MQPRRRYRCLVAALIAAWMIAGMHAGPAGVGAWASDAAKTVPATLHDEGAACGNAHDHGGAAGDRGHGRHCPLPQACQTMCGSSVAILPIESAPACRPAKAAAFDPAPAVAQRFAKPDLHPPRFLSLLG